MNEELKTEEMTPENVQPEEAVNGGVAEEAAQAAEAPAESMADYEEHLDDANPWNLVKKYMEEKTVLPVKIEGVVNGGVIAMVEGLRGFVPASKLSLSYVMHNEAGQVVATADSDHCFLDEAGRVIALRKHAPGFHAILNQALEGQS